MKILSLDSATQSATCAVLDDDKLLGELTFNYKKQHSVLSLPMIDELLKNTGLSIKDIDGFVCSKGPGSFTGLRIGMSLIKGLSQGTKKPLLSISSLDALAYNLAYTNGIVVPILDALRDNVYTALYSFDDNSLVKLTDYMAIHVDELISKFKETNKPITFIGDGVYKFRDKLNESLSNIRFAPTHLNVVKASSLGEIGMNLLKQGIEDDLYTSSPIYLRKSQAEREYEKRRNLNE